MDREQSKSNPYRRFDSIAAARRALARALREFEPHRDPSSADHLRATAYTIKTLVEILNAANLEQRLDALEKRVGGVAQEAAH